MDEREKLAGLFAEALFNGAKQVQQQKNEWVGLFNTYEQLQSAGFTDEEAMTILLHLIQCAFGLIGKDELLDSVHDDGKDW